MALFYCLVVPPFAVYDSPHRLQKSYINYCQLCFLTWMSDEYLFQDIIHILTGLCVCQAWLRLPHDATNSYIHTEVKHGGLGILALRLTSPFMKRARLRCLATLRDPVFVALVTSSQAFAEEVKRYGDPPITVGDTTVTSTPTAKNALAEQLQTGMDYASVELVTASWQIGYKPMEERDKERRKNSMEDVCTVYCDE